MIETSSATPNPMPGDNPHRQQAYEERRAELTDLQAAQIEYTQYPEKAATTGLIDLEHMGFLSRVVKAKARSLRDVLDRQEQGRSLGEVGLNNQACWIEVKEPEFETRLGGQRLSDFKLRSTASHCPNSFEGSNN